MSFTIPASATIYDFDTREEMAHELVAEHIEVHEAIVELSSWKDSDEAWPEADRACRQVVTITPTTDGIRDELSQWVIVMEVSQDSWNDAAESQLESMKILYEEFHSTFLEENNLEVVVVRNHDGDGRLVGWSFSCDSDGASHGNDESYQPSWDWN